MEFRRVLFRSSDRWLLARLDEVVTAVRQAWSDYDVTAGVRALIDFVVDDVSRWYVRRNRPPLPPPHPPPLRAPGPAAGPGASETLHEVPVASARMLTPAAPFVSDWVHRALTGTSVHLASFPTDKGRRARD